MIPRINRLDLFGVSVIRTSISENDTFSSLLVTVGLLKVYFNEQMHYSLTHPPDLNTRTYNFRLFFLLVGKLDECEVPLGQSQIQKQNTSVDLFVYFGPPVILHNKLIRS